MIVQPLKYGSIYFAVVFMSFGITAFSNVKKEIKSNACTIDCHSPQSIEGMTLIWNDEFNTNGQPDTSKWTYEQGFVRNRELQWYQPQNAVCHDGRLLITGKKEKVKNTNYTELSADWRTSRTHAEYTSACIITKGLQHWSSPAYFEIRARIDTSMGSWPAIWLLGDKGSWPANGEIDIMEFYRIKNFPSILANVAWGTEKKYVAKWDSEQKPLSEFLMKDPDWPNKFHIWAMLWDEQKIQLLLDGQIINETSIDQTKNADGSNPFLPGKTLYLLLNLALGENGGDPSFSKFPITYEIDYVRVYKIDR